MKGLGNSHDFRIEIITVDSNVYLPLGTGGGS